MEDASFLMQVQPDDDNAKPGAAVAEDEDAQAEHDDDDAEEEVDDAR
jgi:hypothetical protein